MRDKGTCGWIPFFFGKTKAAIVSSAGGKINFTYILSPVFLDSCTILIMTVSVQWNHSLLKWLAQIKYLFPAAFVCLFVPSRINYNRFGRIFAYMTLVPACHECPTTECCKYLLRWFDGAFPNDTLYSPMCGWFSRSGEVMGISESHTHTPHIHYHCLLKGTDVWFESTVSGRHGFSHTESM